MIPHRPCGACRELVSARTGCPHWKPRVSKTMRANSTPAERASRAEAAEKRRHQRERAREKARLAVAELYRELGMEVPER